MAISQGLRNAIDSFWQNLHNWILSSLIALAVFLGGLWIGHRDLVAVVDGVVAEQATDRLCTRITECPCWQRNIDIINELKQAIIRQQGLTDAHNSQAEIWKDKIKELEHRMYELITRPSSRPDPFTGTEGRALEERIRGLEGKK